MGSTTAVPRDCVAGDPGWRGSGRHLALLALGARSSCRVGWNRQPRASERGRRVPARSWWGTSSTGTDGRTKAPNRRSAAGMMRRWPRARSRSSRVQDSERFVRTSSSATRWPRSTSTGVSSRRQSSSVTQRPREALATRSSASARRSSRWANIRARTAAVLNRYRGSAFAFTSPMSTRRMPAR